MRRRFAEKAEQVGTSEKGFSRNVVRTSNQWDKVTLVALFILCAFAPVAWSVYGTTYANAGTEETVTSEDQGLYEVMYYDATDPENEYTIDDKAEALNNTGSDLLSLNLTELFDDIASSRRPNSQVYKDIKEKIGSDSTITDIAVVANTLEYNQAGSITNEDSGSRYLNVGNGKKWTFTPLAAITDTAASDSLQATLTISGLTLSLKVNVTYNTPTSQGNIHSVVDFSEVTGNDFRNNEQETDPLKATYTPYLKNAQRCDKQTLRQSFDDFKDNQKVVVGTEQSVVVSPIIGTYGWRVEKTDDCVDYFDFKYENGQLTISFTAKKTTSPDFARYNILGEYQEGSRSQSISWELIFEIERAQIEFAPAEDLDFRIPTEADGAQSGKSQEDYVAKQVSSNVNVWSEIQEEEINDFAAISNVEVIQTGSDDWQTGHTYTLKFDITLSDESFKKYGFGDKLVQTTTAEWSVKATDVIDAQGTTDLHSFTLNNGKEGADYQAVSLKDSPNTWENWENIYISGSNYTFGPHIIPGYENGQKTTFESRYEFPSLEGSYKNQTVYDMDSSGVIKQLVNVAYNLDRQAPNVVAFTATSDNYRDFENPIEQFLNDVFGIRLFDSSAHVSITAQDKDPGMTNASSQNDDLPEPAHSGIDFSADNKVEYYDKYNNVANTIDSSSFKEDASDKGTFEFDIDTPNADVDKDSFKAYIKDNAGNWSNGDCSSAIELPEDVQDLVLNSHAPKMNVSFDNNDVHNGKYYNADRTMTVTISCATFNYLKMYDPQKTILSISESGDVHALRVSDFTDTGSRDADGDAIWQWVGTFKENADYSIQGYCEDLLGKKSERFSTEFTIDKINPVCQDITFDNNDAQNGNYFNSARTATIAVEEHNFDPSLMKVKVETKAVNGVATTPAVISAWQNKADNADIHYCTVYFPGFGSYKLSVLGEDLASNQMPQMSTSEFIIATEKPTISVGVNGESDAASRSYKNGAALSVDVEDKVLSPATSIEVTPVGLNSSVNPYAATPVTSATSATYNVESPAQKPENDNVYTAVIKAVDLAGNQESKTVTWSVNRYGSVYVLDDASNKMIDDEYVNANNDDCVDLVVNEINPSGIDESSAQLQLLHETEMASLTKGSDYLFEKGTYQGIPCYKYTVYKNNYQEDGKYEVDIKSTDLAGNSSINYGNKANANRDNPVDIVFNIDNTAPYVTFPNLSSDVEIPESSYAVKFLITDDGGKLDHAEISYNGTEQTFDADALSNPDNLEVTLNETGTWQQVKVKAYDAANNVTEEVSPKVLVSSNPFVIFFNNPLAVTVGVVGVGAIATFVVYKVRLKKTRS